MCDFEGSYASYFIEIALSACFDGERSGRPLFMPVEHD